MQADKQVKRIHKVLVFKNWPMAHLGIFNVTLTKKK